MSSTSTTSSTVSSTTTSSYPSTTSTSETHSSSSDSSSSAAAAKAKLMAANAYDSIKQNVSLAADVTAKNIAKLQSRPTSMTCSNTNCAKTLAIPFSVWTWKCTQGHDNIHANNECETCHETKLNALGNTISWPALLCQNCGTVTAVPHSEFENSLYTGAYMLRHSFHELADSPKTFHCMNCNTLLLVPVGPWVCQTCTTQNYAAAQTCSKCSQSKTAQKVICGQCHKSTGIPTSGLLDNISSAFKQLASSTTKAYMDVTGQQNIACPTCKHPIKIPTSFTPIPVQPENKHQEEAKSSPAATATTGATNTTLANKSWSLTLNCENCHNSFQLLKQQQSGSNAPIISNSTSNTTSTTSATPSVDTNSDLMNGIPHSIMTPDGQQVASMAPTSNTRGSSVDNSIDSTLYNASNAPSSAASTAMGSTSMPASSTTTTTSSARTA